MSNDKPNSWRGCTNGFGGSQSTGTAIAFSVSPWEKTATPSPRSVYAFLFILTSGLLTPGMMLSAIAQVTSDGTTGCFARASR
ncbi:MAG: hypothetical protein V7K62_12510 [Nostoc sp.]